MLSQLGPYLIDEELAEGGMARVFRARLRGLGGFEKQLVIKQIRPELARDARFVELFVREANTLVALSHPHIVQVYELGAAEGTYYLSMEYVEGATIASMLQEGPLAPALTAHVAAQICEALDYAHGRFGILHRDLTPRNIIVDQAGHARLVDFGIATSVTDEDRERFGSPGYMSPEQVAGGRLGTASDMFSLGCVLFEALTGRPAFAKTLRATTQPSAELERLAELPATLAELVRGLLAASPERRPAAREAARLLRGFLAQARPEGVLHDMQARALRAAQREQAARAERRALERAAEPSPGTESVTARVSAQSIATSPVLTELMRSSGLAPIPQPPKPVAAPDTEPAGSSTRRIRDRERTSASAEAAAHAPRATRWMLRVWPLLSLLALAAALGLALRSPRRASVAASDAPRAPNAPSVPRHDSAAANTAGPPEAPPAAARSEENVAPTVDAGSREGPARTSLSVNAMPWAQVSIDGRPQGTTPLRKLKLRAGVHRVELSCPPLGRDSAFNVELPARGETRMVVDLNQNPPRTFLDGAKEVR